jgi:hypothetical protein
MATADTLGFRVLPSPPRLSAELVARFGGLAALIKADIDATLREKGVIA